MNRQEKDDNGSEARRASGSDEGQPVRSSRAPLVVSLILIGAIVLGLGYSLTRRDQEPMGIAGPALVPLASTPSAGTPAASAAPADSAARAPRDGFVESLTN